MTVKQGDFVTAMDEIAWKLLYCS